MKNWVDCECYRGFSSKDITTRNFQTIPKSSVSCYPSSDFSFMVSKVRKQF